MTRITRLVLNGFKSFGKRTELEFGEKFNCVLGPNGSGKSNVLDSLCFVLGRTSAKSMRAEKSANLIYNGGKTKNPSKSGEVSIFFDNSKKVFPLEEQEIKVTRIVKQNGQSVYKINDKTRTRQEVLDLLSAAKVNPDGYNIILQGDIVRFVEMSTVERRKMIEEIAGIAVYEARKEKALRELDKVEERLKQAEIILKERETYLKELKKDRDQAAKYKDLKDRVNENKATYLHIQITRKQEVKEKFEKKIAEEESKLKKIQEEIDKLRKEISQRKEEIEKITKEVEEKGEKEQVAIHREIEQLKVDVATKKTNVENHKNELVRIEKRKEQLKSDLEEHESNMGKFEGDVNDLGKRQENLKKEKSQIEESLKKFKEKHNIETADNIEEQIIFIDKEIDEKQITIQKFREDQQNLLREKDRLEIQLNSIDEQIKKVSEIEKGSKSEIQDIKNKRKLFEELTQELNKCLNDDSSFAVQIANMRKRLSELSEEIAKLEAKNLTIRERASANMAVKKILEQKSKIPGIYGTISELGNAKSKYGFALEVAAGNRISAIVVEDDKIAAQCIKYLKENKFGIATFLPLNKIRGGDELSDKSLLKTDGVHGLCTKLMECDKRFEKVFSWVFGNTIVVDDIETARDIGVGKVRMVTLDGDLVESSGAMQGGFRQKKEGLGFKEVEATKDLDKMIEEREATLKTIKNIENKRAANEERINHLRNEKGTLEAELISKEKILHLEAGDLTVNKKVKEELTSQLKEATGKADKIIETVTEMTRDLAQLKIKKQQFRDKIMQVRNPRILAEMNAFEEKKTHISQQLIEIEMQTKGIKDRVKEMIAPETENIIKILKQLEKEHDHFKQEIKRLEEEIKNREKGLKEKEKNEKEFYARFKELFVQRNKLNEEINLREIKVVETNDKSRKIEIEMNTFSLERAKVAAELSGLEAEFEQYKGARILENKSEQEVKSEIDKFERMVSQIGNVNMKALEIYEQVENEYNSLLEKKATLAVEKQDVIYMMEEIEIKKKELFMKTFETVNETFKMFFLQLSSKGDAFLEIENAQNPFEAGVEIKVRLTGQKFLDIRSLSGGEKTMTALAFIFAIQEHDPASFYILDEVDAALDKQNSEKLAKMVRKYCDRAQYIIISHNDSVISEADNLYGVAMNEHGITNVTTLKI